jgi:hypothetical protein
MADGNRLFLSLALYLIMVELRKAGRADEPALTTVIMQSNSELNQGESASLLRCLDPKLSYSIFNSRGELNHV